MKYTLVALSLGCSFIVSSFAEAKTPDSKTQKAPSKVSKGTAKVLIAKKQEMKKPPAMSVEHPFVQALMSAYSTNADLKATARRNNAVAEGLAKAYSGWRPKISATASLGTARSTDHNVDPITGAKIADVTRKLNPKTTALEVQQNIFEGGRTLANTTIAENQIIAAHHQFFHTEQQTLLSAVQAYLDLWFKRRQLEITRTSVKFFETNVEHTKARADLGEVGLTEMAEAEFRYEEALADFVAAEAEVQNATAYYIKIIGQQPPKELVLPVDIGDMVTLPQSLDELKNVATKEYPPVLQAIYDAKAAEAGIDYAQAELMPRVDLVGSAGKNINTNYAGSRIKDLSAQVRVTVPLYNQGADWADVRSSHQTAAQKSAEVAIARRDAIEAAVKAWEVRFAARGQLKKLEAQIKAGEVRIEGTRQESLVGERTLLDVLNAQRDVVGARINLARATRDFLSSGYQILTVLGQLSPSLLNLPVQKYDVKGYAEEASGKYIGWGDVPSREEIRDAAGAS